MTDAPPKNGNVILQKLFIPLAITAIVGAVGFWVQASVAEARMVGAIERLGDRVQTVGDLLIDIRRDLADHEQRIRELERRPR